MRCGRIGGRHTRRPPRRLAADNGRSGHLVGTEHAVPTRNACAPSSSPSPLPAPIPANRVRILGPRDVVPVPAAPMVCELSSHAAPRHPRRGSPSSGARRRAVWPAAAAIIARRYTRRQDGRLNTARSRMALRGVSGRTQITAADPRSCHTDRVRRLAGSARHPRKRGHLGSC